MKDEKSEKVEKLSTRASALDAIILAGGNWDALIAEANKAAAPLKTKVKTYTVALLKTHIRYREAKNPKFFASVKVGEEGITVKTTK